MMTSVSALCLRSDPRESHDIALQERLRHRARGIAEGLASRPGTIAVFLTGSVARGPVGPHSDLDLLLLTSNSCVEDVPVWQFAPDGVIENIHVTTLSSLETGLKCEGDDAALAAWFANTLLGEELAGSEILIWLARDDLREPLESLLHRRSSAGVMDRLAQRYADDARRRTNAAEVALGNGAVADCHQELRHVVQSLLISALVQRGWTLRGAKKQPEIAVAFLPDPRIQAILELTDAVMGLEDLTLPAVRQICQARLAIRASLGTELSRLQEKLSSDSSVRLASAHHVRHNTGARDYYETLLDDGFLRGPVNHIRALSGFPLIPSILAHAAHGCAQWPIQEFITSKLASIDFRLDWLSVASLTTESSQCERWIARALDILNH